MPSTPSHEPTARRPLQPSAGRRLTNWYPLASRTSVFAADQASGGSRYVYERTTGLGLPFTYTTSVSGYIAAGGADDDDDDGHGPPKVTGIHLLWDAAYG